MSEIINDPDNYRAMCVPFDTPTEANESLAGFQKELSELRKKYRIADLLWVSGVVVKYPEGEGIAMCHGSYGDPLKPLTMAAYVFGQEQAEQRSIVNRLISGKHPFRLD